MRRAGAAVARDVSILKTRPISPNKLQNIHPVSHTFVELLFLMYHRRGLWSVISKNNLVEMRGEEETNIANVEYKWEIR